MDRSSTKLSQLEFRVFRESRARWSSLGGADVSKAEVSAPKVLAMVSGGADSMAMLRVLKRLRTRLGFQLEILHVHHGEDVEQGERRDRACNLVYEFANKAGISFHVRKSPLKLKSESDFRKFRWEAIYSVWESARVAGTAFTCVAFAHHRDDLLETRLIRLLRGTGAQGLRAMRAWGMIQSVLVWRPLLSSSSLEIREYLALSSASLGKDWVEDLTNSETKFLRNAIRHTLLPQIEAMREGGVEALTRSLEIICEELPEETGSAFHVDSRLSRRELMSLSPEKQRAKLGQWLKHRGVESYSQAQINEVLKRLDTDQRRLKFEVCGRVWLVDEMVEIVALPRQV